MSEPECLCDWCRGRDLIRGPDCTDPIPRVSAKKRDLHHQVKVFKLQLQDLAGAVRKFRNLDRLGKRKHRKLRQSKEYRDLCLAWEDASELIDATGGIWE